MDINSWVASRYRTGSGSDRVKDSTFVHEGMVRKVQGEYLDPCSKWLDPVATAPGSVPRPLFSVARPNKLLDRR